MMFDHIVGLGDSWMWGDELVDPDLGDAHPIDHRNTAYRESHCFLGLLGQHYNVPVSNLAWPGGSLQLCIHNYIWWLQTYQDIQQPLFLVALTDAGRVSWINPRHVRYSNDPPWNQHKHNIWLRHHDPFSLQLDDWSQLAKLHDTLTDCQASREFQYKQTVMFFEGQSHGHQVRQFNVARPPCQYNSNILLWPNQNIADFLDKSDLQPGRHPNENGHKKLAQLLISQLDML